MQHIGKLLEEKTLVIEKAADEATRKGFTQIPNVILKHRELSFGAKTVYGLLLSFAWSNNEIFPGQQTLARDAGTTRQTINKYIKELERAGYLSIKRRGLGKTAIYTVHVRVRGGKVDEQDE